MIWLLFIIELAVSVALIVFMAFGSAFQSESLRFATPLTKVIDVVTVLLTLAPLVFVIWSAIVHLRGQPPRFGVWLLILVACGGLSFGSLILKERVGYAAKDAAEQRKRTELAAAAESGNGEAACALVNMGPPFEPALFARCRGFIEAAPDASERFRRIAALTSSGWLTLWPSDGDQSVVAVPSDQQSWFAATFLTSMLAAAPGSSDLKPVADDTFNDLLVAGTVISGVLRPGCLDAPALRAGAALIPQVESYYRARIALADTKMPERATYIRSVLRDAASAGLPSQTP